MKDKHIKAITGTMKIHELTTKHENSPVDHKTRKFTSSPQNKQRKLNTEKPVVYVMRNFAMVTNFSLLNSRVVQRKRNKAAQTNENKDLHKTQIRTAEEKHITDAGMSSFTTVKMMSTM